MKWNLWYDTVKGDTWTYVNIVALLESFNSTNRMTSTFVYANTRRDTTPWLFPCSSWLKFACIIEEPLLMTLVMIRWLSRQQKHIMNYSKYGLFEIWKMQKSRTKSERYLSMRKVQWPIAICCSILCVGLFNTIILNWAIGSAHTSNDDVGEYDDDADETIEWLDNEFTGICENRLFVKFIEHVSDWKCMEQFARYVTSRRKWIWI